MLKALVVSAAVAGLLVGCTNEREKAEAAAQSNAQIDLGGGKTDLMPLNAGERKWVDTQVALAKELSVIYTPNAGERLDAQELDALALAYLANDSVTSLTKQNVTLALAGAFGELVAQDLAMEWAVADKKLIVVNIDKGLMGEPIVFATKRMNEPESVSFVQGYEDLAGKI